IGRDRSLQESFCLCPVGVYVGWVRDICQTHVVQLFFGVAENLPIFSVDPQICAVNPHMGYSHRGLVKNAPETLLGLSKRAFRTMARGYVNSNQLHKCPPSTHDQGGRDENIQRLAASDVLLGIKLDRVTNL